MENGKRSALLISSSVLLFSSISFAYACILPRVSLYYRLAMTNNTDLLTDENDHSTQHKMNSVQAR